MTLNDCGMCVHHFDTLREGRKENFPIFQSYFSFADQHVYQQDKFWQGNIFPNKRNELHLPELEIQIVSFAITCLSAILNQFTPSNFLE